MIVLDASAAIEWLLQTKAGARVEARIFAGPRTLHAPYLLDIEVAQVLRRYVAAGTISESRGREALQDMNEVPLTRYPHHVLLDRIWQLRKNLTAYDAAMWHWPKAWARRCSPVTAELPSQPDIMRSLRSFDGPAAAGPRSHRSRRCPVRV